MSSPEIAQARAIATMAHRGQVDKAGVPYIQHPERIIKILINSVRSPSNADLCTALLHDVLEDTDVTAAELLEWGVDPAVVEAVQAITHLPGEPNGEYWERVRTNPTARRVKFADIEDNTDPRRLHHLPEQTQIRLIRKYAQALEALNFVEEVKSAVRSD